MPFTPPDKLLPRMIAPSDVDRRPLFPTWHQQVHRLEIALLLKVRQGGKLQGNRGGGGLVGHVRPLHAWLRPTLPPTHPTLPPTLHCPPTHPASWQLTCHHAPTSGTPSHLQDSVTSLNIQRVIVDQRGHFFRSLPEPHENVLVKDTLDAKLELRDKIWQGIRVRTKNDHFGTKTDHLRNYSAFPGGSSCWWYICM